MGVKTDIDHGISTLKPSNQFCTLSESSWYRTFHSKCAKSTWVKWSRSFYSLYSLNKTTDYPRIPVKICVSKNMILNQKLTISGPVIREWEIGTYLLAFHPAVYSYLVGPHPIRFYFFLTCVTTKNCYPGYRKRPNLTQEIYCRDRVS